MNRLRRCLIAGIMSLALATCTLAASGNPNGGTLNTLKTRQDTHGLNQAGQELVNTAAVGTVPNANLVSSSSAPNPSDAAVTRHEQAVLKEPEQKSNVSIDVGGRAYTNDHGEYKNNASDNGGPATSGTEVRVFHVDPTLRM